MGQSLLTYFMFPSTVVEKTGGQMAFRRMKLLEEMVKQQARLLERLTYKLTISLKLKPTFFTH